MNCPNCGAILPDDSSFCTNCGSQLNQYQVPFTPQGTPGQAPMQQAPYGMQGQAPMQQAPYGMQGQAPMQQAPYGMPGQQGNGGEPGPKKSNTGLIVALIIVGLLIVAAIVTTVILLNKKDDDESDKDNKTTIETTTEAPTTTEATTVTTTEATTEATTESTTETTTETTTEAITYDESMDGIYELYEIVMEDTVISKAEYEEMTGEEVNFYLEISGYLITIYEDGESEQGFFTLEGDRVVVGGEDDLLFYDAAEHTLTLDMSDSDDPADQFLIVFKKQ